MNKVITYYSTNRKAREVSFKEALLKGLAPDGGLYMPSFLPAMSPGELESLISDEYPEVASKILNKLIGNEIDSENLKFLCHQVYDFPIPFENPFDRVHIMRLDHGPTASFKDFAARMMGRLMQHFLNIDKQYVTILTATSGDTGSAIANAFYGLNNIRVIILFPANEVTELQRKQMTTLKRNIRVIAIDGKFDDCQHFVKRAFMDPLLSDLRLTSANSINVGRLLPQSVYYFYAWAKLSGRLNDKIVFSVPSGNFGNLMGGLISKEMGLPVYKYIIATNENDEVPRYLENEVYNIIRPSKKCISSAMNVGHPSNMARIVSLYGGMMDEKGMIIRTPDIDRMRSDFFGISVTDKETRDTISECYKKYGLILEPHGAVAWRGLSSYLNQMNDISEVKHLYISLETAHPAKFQEEILRTLNFNPEMPLTLAKVRKEDEEYLSFDNNYILFRDFIIKNYK